VCARVRCVWGCGAFCQRRGNESRCFRVRFLRSRLPRESGLTATYESVTYSVIIQRGDTLKYRTPYFTAAGNAASQTPLGINKP